RPVVVVVGSVCVKAEDGIRGSSVAGVQTCALPISFGPHPESEHPGYHKKWLCAIGIPAASGRGVRFLGADQNLSAFFCRSSEMRSEERRVGKEGHARGRPRRLS